MQWLSLSTFYGLWLYCMLSIGCRSVQYPTLKTVMSAGYRQTVLIVVLVVYPKHNPNN